MKRTTPYCRHLSRGGSGPRQSKALLQVIEVTELATVPGPLDLRVSRPGQFLPGVMSTRRGSRSSSEAIRCRSKELAGPPSPARVLCMLCFAAQLQAARVLASGRLSLAVGQCLRLHHIRNGCRRCFAPRKAPLFPFPCSSWKTTGRY